MRYGEYQHTLQILLTAPSVLSMPPIYHHHVTHAPPIDCWDVPWHLQASDISNADPRPSLVPGRSAVKLGVLACLLFQLSSGVDGYFEGQPLPDQLTARNITITLRTVVRGLSYLMTFLFAANTVGLTGDPLRLPLLCCFSHAHDWDCFLSLHAAVG